MTSIAGSTIAKARFFLDCADGVGNNEWVSFFAITLRRLDLSANANHDRRLAAISRTRRVPTLVHNKFPV
jgi:hypothetical protein